mgnify:CR=1 FL=1
MDKPDNRNTPYTSRYPWKRFLGLFSLSALLIALLIAFWQDFWSFSQTAPSFSLRMTAKTTEPKIAQLFYDLGSGFSAEQCATASLAGDGRYHDYLFPIPAQAIHGFRFDPATSSGALAIQSADIVMEIAKDIRITVEKIDLKNLKPGNQIKELTFKAGELGVVTAENADDPQIFIPVSLNVWFPASLFWYVVPIIIKILPVGLLCGILMGIWFQWDDKPSGMIAILALIVFGLRCGSLLIDTLTPMLNVSVQSSVYGEMQLYYDVGQGLSEMHSTKTIVYPDAKEQTYRMKLPREPIGYLRIDPPISRDSFVMGNISITDGLGYPVSPLLVDLKNAFANQDIIDLQRQGSMISLHTRDNAPDPQVHIPLAAPLLAKMELIPFLIRIAIEFLVIAAASLAAILFCRSARTTNQQRWPLFFAAIGILFIRYPGIMLNPRFLAEEGSLFFQRAYQSAGISLSTFFYNYEIVGYYNFIADFAAWAAATFFSLPYAPYATLLASFFFQVFPLYLIAMSRSALWNSPLRRTMGILLVLLVPVSSDVWLTTIGTQYHLGLIAFLILLESGERHSAFETWLQRVMLLIGGFSGISSCLMTPFYFLKAWQNRQRETLLQALLLSFAVFVQLFSLLYSSNTRLSNPGDAVSLTANVVNANFVSTLFGPTAASLLSQILYGMIETAFSELIVILAVMLVFEGIFLLFLLKRFHNPRLFFYVIGALGLTIAVAYIGMINGKWETVDPYNASRYFWLPNVILAFCVLFAIKEQPSFRATIRRNMLAAFCLLMIVIHGALHYDMTGYGQTMPSWRKEAALWMQDKDKQTIALWPQGWHLILERRE